MVRGLEMAKASRQLMQLQKEIISCQSCPRLVNYREEVASKKRTRYKNWDYWGAPVPSNGDAEGRLLIIGLAPASHGANRTGRLFTGDLTADFLVEALFKAGFSSKPISRFRGDGTTLIDAYQLAVVRCCPPGDKPTTQEQNQCRGFLVRELSLLRQIRVVLVFGRIAFENYRRALSQLTGKRFSHVFKHGAEYDLGGDLPTLFVSYHPSPRNTNTGRLTKASLDSILAKVRHHIQALHPVPR